MPSLEDRSKHILIVEDEGLIAADVQRKIERLGYPIPAIAQSGVEAIRCARSTPFDLVLMDIRLKGDMDGIATAHALKNEFELPVVYMTAHADQETIGRAKLTEPLGYILKPITDGDLRSVVQIALYRHQMEQRIRTSEAWLSTTLRSVGDGIIATDTAGEIVFMNAVAEKLTGWSSEEGRGQLLLQILGLFEGPTLQPARNPIGALPSGESKTYHLAARDGTETLVEVQCFENRSTAISPSSGQPQDDLIGTIVVLRDHTAHKRMEDRLVQSQRMEAVANMAGALAHDFNNQLAVILGYAEELCAESKGSALEAASEIKQAASVAGSITGQLLMLSRRSESRLEVLNVNEVVCELQPMISHTLGRKRTLVANLGCPEGFVRFDRNQLKQILLNLALNARDAMPRGGELHIDSATADLQPDSREGRLYRAGQFVRLRVSDTGDGMDEATLERIFEPFFTTKKAGFGTGLGLSIAHSIISQGGGYIRAESEPGRGSTFEIMLPCVGTFRRISDITGSKYPGGDDHTPTILLVEDEDAIRRLIHKYLEREGYQLLEARNAEEAEAIAEVYREPIHVLVTDVLMPGMTGPELAVKLMPLRPDMKILFVSGYRGDALEKHGLSAGALNLLAKPFSAFQLLQRVQTLLVQGQPVQ